MIITHIKDMIKRHEGFSAMPYRCPRGYLTIGYGTNLDAGITEEEADALLTIRIQALVKYLSTFLPCWDQLTETRQIALIDLAYNVGIKGFKSFKKMLAALNNAQFKIAALELLDSRYATQVPQRAFELADMIRKGEP